VFHFVTLSMSVLQSMMNGMILSMPSTPHKSTRASRNLDRERKLIISLPAINQLLPTIHLTRDDD